VSVLVLSDAPGSKEPVLCKSSDLIRRPVQRIEDFKLKKLEPIAGLCYWGFQKRDPHDQRVFISTDFLNRFMTFGSFDWKTDVQSEVNPPKNNIGPECKQNIFGLIEKSIRRACATKVVCPNEEEGRTMSQLDSLKSTMPDR
jgi:hypothetical protein